MPRTLYDLIRTVSFNAGDLEEGTLTGADSTTVLHDSGRNDPDGWWTGNALALVGTTASPLNAGVEKNIAAWLSTGTFTTNAFPAVPSTGDKYELRRNKFHTRATVKEFLNQAIREIKRQSWIAVDSRLDLADLSTYRVGVLEYPVPAVMEFVHRVLYLDISGVPQTLSTTLPATPATGDYYYQTDLQTVVEWSGSAWVPSYRAPWVELNYDWWETNVRGSILIQEARDYSWSPELCQAPIIDGAPLAFQGSQRPAELVNETDSVNIEGNYLEVFATARLCLRLARGAQDSADFQQKFTDFYKLEADAFRGTRRGLPGGSRKVRP